MHKKGRMADIDKNIVDLIFDLIFHVMAAVRAAAAAFASLLVWSCPALSSRQDSATTEDEL
jgi:hypothetical protein